MKLKKIEVTVRSRKNIRVRVRVRVGIRVRDRIRVRIRIRNIAFLTSNSNSNPNLNLNIQMKIILHNTSLEKAVLRNIMKVLGLVDFKEGVVDLLILCNLVTSTTIPSGTLSKEGARIIKVIKD
jgi:hypothetical protein